MFLQSLKITNLRSIGNLTLDVYSANSTTRRRTLLLGENGTGKSSLLRAIALVTAGSNALGELLGNSDDWIRNGAEYCELEAVIINKDLEQRLIQLRINRGDTYSDILSRNKEMMDLLDRAIRHADRNYFVVGYGASRRFNTGEGSWYSSRGAYKNDRSNNVATLFTADAELNPLTAWAIDVDYQSSNGIKVIREALDDFLPGVQFHSIDKARKQLLFRTPDGIIPLHLLSDGYQNMTAWVGDLLYRISNSFGDYRSPLQARGLLLIDEIELHIHPKWQRYLLDFINTKLPNFQIVATSHSPLTAQQATDGELFILKRLTDKVTLVPFKGDPQKMLLHQLLMTDAFGLSSDESIKVESAKNAYRELRDKPKRSTAETKQMKTLANELNELPPANYTNSLISSEQMELLKRLDQELK